MYKAHFGWCLVGIIRHKGLLLVRLGVLNYPTYCFMILKWFTNRTKIVKQLTKSAYFTLFHLFLYQSDVVIGFPIKA
jgi:hypothetical protein